MIDPQYAKYEQAATKEIPAEVWLYYYKDHLLNGRFEEAHTLRRNFFAALRVSQEQWQEIDQEIRGYIRAGMNPSQPGMVRQPDYQGEG
jgi:hypothetical protein